MLAQEIRKRRREKEITQQGLSNLLGVDQSAVACWESGKTTPQTDKLPLLAKALGCTIDDLFKED